MSRHTIPNDATIADIIGSLNKPVEYVREVYRHMMEFKRDFDAVSYTVSVRIGVTGEGRAPHYRIEHTKQGQLPSYLYFNGSNHKEDPTLRDWLSEPLEPIELITGSRNIMHDNWSRRTMDLNEIKDLWEKQVRR